MTPRYKVGSWLGDLWVAPPGWRVLGQKDFQHLFQNKSMLWLGDSTGRRAAMTLYNILNRDGSSTAQDKVTYVRSGHIEENIDVNRKRQNEPCRKLEYVEPEFVKDTKRVCRSMPNDPHNDFVWIDKNCIHEVDTLIQKELAQVYNMTFTIDVMVIALGIWHDVRGGQCTKHDPKRREAYEQAKDLVNSLYQLLERRPSLTVIWRTSGFSNNGNASKVWALNEFTMDYIDNHTMTLSWGRSSSLWATTKVGFSRNDCQCCGTAAIATTMGAKMPHNVGQDRCNVKYNECLPGAVHLGLLCHSITFATGRIIAAAHMGPWSFHSRQWTSPFLMGWAQRLRDLYEPARQQEVKRGDGPDRVTSHPTRNWSDINRRFVSRFRCFRN